MDSQSELRTDINAARQYIDRVCQAMHHSDGHRPFAVICTPTAIRHLEDALKCVDPTRPPERISSVPDEDCIGLQFRDVWFVTSLRDAHEYAPEGMAMIDALPLRIAEVLPW